MSHGIAVVHQCKKLCALLLELAIRNINIFKQAAASRLIEKARNTKTGSFLRDAGTEPKLPRSNCTINTIQIDLFTQKKGSSPGSPSWWPPFPPLLGPKASRPEPPFYQFKRVPAFLGVNSVSGMALLLWGGETRIPLVALCCSAKRKIYDHQKDALVLVRAKRVAGVRFESRKRRNLWYRSGNRLKHYRKYLNNR